jgi:hypothetical protein
MATRTPRAEWKADEAEFFLSHLREVRMGSTDPRYKPLRVFAFYLSACLGAAYSSRVVLRLEALQDKLVSRDEFDGWHSKWEASLTEAEARIWKLGWDERGREVHHRGTETTPVSGVAVVRPPRFWHGGIYGSILAAPGLEPTWPLLDDEAAAALASVVPLQFATFQHFEVEGERLEVVKTCADYLALLRRYITDFRTFAITKPDDRR